MNILEKIIKFLQFEMNKPTSYGWFHIMCLLITIIVIYILIKKRPNLKKTILSISVIMLLFEVYKQLSFSYSGEIWKYQWYAFPFQFCSIPMYVAFNAGIAKNKNIESFCYSFLATYGLVAGICVMFYPNDVFVKETLINIQTMVHHGSMVIMGVYILSNKVLTNRKETFIKALSVFLVSVALALLIDISTFYFHIDEGLKMFFISPYHKSTLPVFNIIYDKVPYAIFLLLYVLSFSTATSIPLLFVGERKK